MPRDPDIHGAPRGGGQCPDGQRSNLKRGISPKATSQRKTKRVDLYGPYSSFTPDRPVLKSQVLEPWFVEVIKRDGVLYPMAPIVPDPEDRRELGFGPNFDFGNLVWGSNGHDFTRIQNEFVDTRLELAWGYREDITGSEIVVQGYFPKGYVLPKAPRFLAIGLAEARKNGDDAWFPKPMEPLIPHLWDHILQWARDLRTGKKISLLRSLEIYWAQQRVAELQGAPDSTSRS
ncbi:hypothetical protein FSARC_7915 [Fusarium sarcochroum]|uniref:Uncharacterized protein n=1 Tax=Fusarium sarcochroum TaxID=1208366 RepID=A0A8H4TUD1_9HYPO|nr:hypothetical protein FSARC_7915 [Fusarium sarcochroum]